MILQRFDDVGDAAAALSTQVIAALRVGLAWRGRASLVVPGGRTPVPLFHALRDAELDWAQVGITLTDERWVPEDHAGSNAALVRRELLAGRAGAARFVPLFQPGTGDAARGAADAWQAVQSLALPFDAVVLGMGEDGHFASLFPGDPLLPVALDTAVAPGCVPMQAPVEPADRISLNLPALLGTRRLFLFVTGEAKRNLLLAAARRDPGRHWPVSALLAQRHPLPEVFWAP